ncbi:hypothetical protein [Paenibacillus maysiensis]|uniref:hypothetical protein n=1 Tax=Paenibacillus maysiensis TaxID=1155954 RepID=UPI0004B0DB95|nr:hypothetical protein [Paenibacillus maysiensis]
MAKREQVVAEELKKQQPVEEGEKEVRSIALARVAYEQFMDDIRSYCQQARELREQSAVLQQSAYRFSG